MHAPSKIASFLSWIAFARLFVACGGQSVSTSSRDGAAPPLVDGGNAADVATTPSPADDASPADATSDMNTVPDANTPFANPWVVASNQQEPAAIATDDTNVYWRNLGSGRFGGKTPGNFTGGTIMACPVAGCAGAAPETIVGSLTIGSYAWFAFATDGTNIYFDADPVDAGTSLFACPTSGCLAPQVVAHGFIGNMATVDGGVYWIDPADSPSCAAFTCPASGCSSAPSCIWTPVDGGAENLQSDFVVDGAFAYWMDLFGNVSQCSLPSCGSQPTTLFGGIIAARALAVAAGFVYVADANPVEGAIYQCPATGCPEGAQALASGLSGVTAIAADASYVYWTELGDYESAGTVLEGTGVVRRCAVTGCNGVPETFAVNLTDPVAIAVGANAVFWVEQGNGADTGRIWAAAK
jgi:hypothetical protein